MRRFQFFKLWFYLAANIAGMRTACMETAAAGRIDGTGNIPLKRRQHILHFGIGDWNRIQKRIGIRMHRVGKEVFFIGDFDQIAQVHHADIIAYVFNNA